MQNSLASRERVDASNYEIAWEISSALLISGTASDVGKIMYPRWFEGAFSFPWMLSTVIKIKIATMILSN